MSKIILPEAEQPETLGVHVKPFYEKENSLFEAIINGADAGVKMIVGIVALLIAVLGLVALVDLCLASLGAWPLKTICGYIFYPFTIILGVPLSDAETVSKIIGERLIVTEVVAYSDLATALKENLLQHPRSAVITIYALCGFAHLASMAIFVGGVCALAPERIKNIGPIAIRALLAATLACLMTACVAGTFFTGGSILLGA
jgi:CNT family concentrative nucleoside transporter